MATYFRTNFFIEDFKSGLLVSVVSLSFVVLLLSGVMS